MSRPFLPLVAALAAGISLANACHIPDLYTQMILVVTLAMIILFNYLKMKRIIHLLIVISFFLMGILSLNLYLYPYIPENHIIHFIGNEKIRIEGIICENPQRLPERTDIVIEVSRILRDDRYIPVSGRVMLSIHDDYRFRFGDYLRCNVRLRIPRNFSNEGGFDYEKYLRFRKIAARGFVKDATGFIVLRHDMGNVFQRYVERFRDLIRNSIEENAPGTEGKIIQAMILGDQKGIPREVMEKFNRTGTTHIIAISGFNIAMVAVFILLLIRTLLRAEYFLQRWNVKKLSMFFAIIVVIFYTFIAGSGISVVRASIMVTVFLFSVIFNRENDLYNTLALAAFLILILNPYSLFDISFQLSFVAVASLIFFMPPLTALLPDPPPIKSINGGGWIQRQMGMVFRNVAIFLFASLCATLSTLPLIMLYFNRLSLITLAANVICVPILGVMAIPACMLIILTAPMSSVLSSGIIRICEILVRISIYMIDRLAEIPWASVYVPTPNLFEIMAYYIILIGSGLILREISLQGTEREHRGRTAIAKVLIALTVFFFIFDGIHQYVKRIYRQDLSMTVADVGHGNSILINFPGGTTMLVDGGGSFDGSFDIGEYVLAPFLWHKRITSLDVVVLTHPHPDHLNGLLFIMENFHVRKVWLNGDSSETDQYRSFCTTVLEKGIVPVILSDKTEDAEISGVKIQIMNPQKDEECSNNRPGPVNRMVCKTASENKIPPKIETAEKTKRQISNRENDRSIVIKLTFKKRSILLPADISETVERDLILSGRDLSSDVIVVPHHGSRSSSGIPFLEKVKPKIAVISCGTNNVSIPHPEVIRRYERIHANIYRTDRDGAVTIKTDGDKIGVMTFYSRGFQAPSSVPDMDVLNE